MSRRVLPYILALSTVVPAYAQQGQVSLDLGSSAPWYNIRGPRVSFEFENPNIGKLSGVYVPVSEEREKAKDMHVIWTVPSNLTGKNLTLEPIFEHSDARGLGGGLKVTKNLAESVQLSARGEAFGDGVEYGEAKLLSKHFDAAFGAEHDNALRPYGYFTINAGKWDDTFTLGWDPKNNLWNNFSFERNNYGVFSLNYYQPRSGDFTIDAFAGVRNIDKFWYERAIDRFVASQDINPKERSFIPSLPSYLVFGDWSGEFRADRTDNKTFVNMGAGRTIKIGKAKVGSGLGIEYVKKPEDVIWKPNGEFFIALPVLGFDFSLQKRFRKEEGSFLVTAARKF